LSEQVTAQLQAGPARRLPSRLCLVATVPSTLRAFYQPLIKSLCDAGHLVTLIASPGVELDEFRRTAPVQTHCVPITRAISPFRDLRSILMLIRIFRAQAFDLVHTHTPKAGLLGMIASCMARVPRRVHTLHGLPLETARGLKRRLLIMADRLTCGLAHKVCVVSASLRHRALDLQLCDPRKAVVLADGTACGVDLLRFTRTTAVLDQAAEIRRKLAIPPDAIVLGFVGWLVADKGVAELIDVFTALAKRHDNLHLLMIGPEGGKRDPLPPRTLGTIRQHRGIHYAGLVSDPVPFYAAMDLCVLPTRREGFPYALLEAAALEVPVVATRVTGCVDAVVDGETGLLVDPVDPEGLAAAVERLARDPVLRSALGTAARRRVQASFGSDRLVQAHLALYGALGVWCGPAS